ncbi:MAG: ABC transporter substrate-binding protein [Caldilineaceae bacterium]
MNRMQDLSRRQFMKLTSAIGFTAALAACAAPATPPSEAAPAASGSDAAAAPAVGGAKSEIARKDTLVHVGGETEVLEPTNFNPYSLGGLGRIRGPLNKTIFEFLYYYNHNDGKEIPWLAESYKVADDFTSIDVAIRQGVTWNDGTPFTSDDVKFTLEKLRDTPELAFASDMKEWVKDVTVTDEQHFTINLNKANPRFFYFYFIENSEIQIAILPKHIWENEDWTTFQNYDPAKGLPVGTGPFKLVEAGPQGVFFDRDDNWWGVKTGFSQASKVTRQSFIPLGAGAALQARMINNEVDVDVTFQPGEFVAANAQNPDLISWNATGPSWGVPDACLFTLGLNTQWGPMADVHVRRAVQAAINRQKMIDLAYEGATVPLVLPFSTFGGLDPYRELCQDLVDKYKPDNPSQELVDSEMKEAGYEKDSDGFWGKDGTRLTPDFRCASWLAPMAPVVEKQLRDAGFDVSVKLVTTDNNVFFQTVQQGKGDIWIIVHCGSSREPWGTLQHYHSRFSSPEQGTTNSYIWANSQYKNPDYDAIIDQLDGIPPSPTDKKYTDLVRQAVEIYLRDVIEITMSEERWLRIYNYHYWKGWPNAADPYVAPYALWASIMTALLKIEPTGAE